MAPRCWPAWVLRPGLQSMLHAIQSCESRLRRNQTPKQSGPSSSNMEYFDVCIQHCGPFRHDRFRTI